MFYEFLNNTMDVKYTGKTVVSANCEKNKMKNVKILIAEDEETSDMLITIALNKISREVIHVKTGVKAVEACMNNPDIDVVMMDIKMPEMDGYEATRKIRQFNKNVVIIAQTAYGMEGDREKALMAGCDDYISKPIRLSKFTEIVKKHFNIF